jgi:hypothetical protein
MSELLVNRYQFKFKVLTPMHLNFYSGSMLRGAFGHALRYVSCMTKMSECKPCPLYRTCPYPLVFETPPPITHELQNFSQIPSPYVIEPPPLGAKDYQEGEILTFSMVLIGGAIQQLPLVIYAWQRALDRGVGKMRSRAELIEVVSEPGQDNEQSIYMPEYDETIAPHTPKRLDQLEIDNQIELSFVTPLRIQKQGKTVSHRMTARDLMMSLVRRYFLLAEFHTETYQAPNFRELSEAAESLQIKTDLRWCDWTRYSSRQHQAMSLGGVLGQVTLEGSLTPFSQILNVGQWIHAGNKTSFGMGGYTLISTD